MFECHVTEEPGLKWITLKGRIDAMSAAAIGKALDALVMAGERIIGADFEGVVYLSSAGLRVFLVAQKQLSKAGGEIILVNVISEVLEVFKMSGLDRLFRFCSSRNEAGVYAGAGERGPQIASDETGGLLIHSFKMEGEPRALITFGDPKKLGSAEYDEEDVVSVLSSDMLFGTGLGSLGNEYGHYKRLFGEAMVIHGNFFFYPSVERPSVDFMLITDRLSRFTYRFFHGFGFDSGYHNIVSFAEKEEEVSLDVLVRTLFKVSEVNLLGIVLLAESKGIWGMHLKRSPIKEHRPKEGGKIFDSMHIKDWVDMPVEPAFANHLIVGTGIAIRKKGSEPPGIRPHIPENQQFHIHAGVFEKGLFSNDPKNFDDEINRVLRELDVYRIQHLMGRSRFKSGMVGIVELELDSDRGAVDSRR